MYSDRKGIVQGISLTFITTTSPTTSMDTRRPRAKPGHSLLFGVCVVHHTPMVKKRTNPGRLQPPSGTESLRYQELQTWYEK